LAVKASHSHKPAVTGTARGQDEKSLTIGVKK
jgi:hypothetical protein